MKRILLLLLIIGLGPLIGGLYGNIHDQLTYTISPEYYTKFKFYQFGLLEEGQQQILLNTRFSVLMVGFMATWWMGLPIGLILGLVGLSIKDNKQLFIVTLKAFVLTTVVAFITGLIGLAYGKLVLVDTEINWCLPDKLIDKKNFIAVGSMHNFSYIGGLTGLIAGIIYIVKQRKKLRN